MGRRSRTVISSCSVALADTAGARAGFILVMHGQSMRANGRLAEGANPSWKKMTIGCDHMAKLRRRSTSANPLLSMIAVMCVFSLTGCHSEENPFRRQKSVSRIALIGIGKNHPTWPVLQCAAKQISGRRGRLDVVVLAPDTPSPQAQQQILEQLQSGQFDAVCISPIDSSTLGPTILETVRRGVPVVTIGRDVPDSSRSAYSGPLEVDLGRETARACERLSGGLSNSIMLVHAGADDEFYGARYGAFKAYLPAAKGLTLLRELNCRRNVLDAMELVKAESRKYPRSAGWALLDDWPLRAIGPTERLLPPGVGIVLCNADPRYNDAVRDGRITAMIGYDFREAVQQAVHAAARLGTDTGKGTLASEISIPPEIITKEDLLFWEARWRAWQIGEPPPTTWPAATPRSSGPLTVGG